MDIYKEFIILQPTESKVITASVGIISPITDTTQFLAIKNKRGWDIPGGHTEANESSLQTLHREVEEESGCSILPGATQIAVLESMANPHTGIAVFKAQCEVGEFTPTAEISERGFFSATELLQEYFGDKELLALLLQSIHD